VQVSALVPPMRQKVFHEQDNCGGQSQKNVNFNKDQLNCLKQLLKGD
jgi:hypothetical protein